MAQDDTDKELTDALFRESTLAGDSAFMEQYKLYLEMLDNISERRQHANNFFLTVNTGVCAFIGYIFSKDAAIEFRSFFWFVPVAGILLSYFWYRLIRSYRDLNTAKFKVVHLMEQRLPLAPYHTEWLALGEAKDPKRYVPFTHLEIWIPRSFMLMYAVLIIYMIPWRSIFHPKQDSTPVPAKPSSVVAPTPPPTTPNPQKP
jgi:hypothetical protein